VTEKCPVCKEELGPEPVVWRGKRYCSETCAFEASQKPNLCGAPRTLETGRRSLKTGLSSPRPPQV